MEASAEPKCQVREATEADAPAVAAALGQLLVELSGGGPAASELEKATTELVRDKGMGALLVADGGGEDGVVGVLAASWQHAVHVPGRYGTIQDLWVHPEWRSKAIGHDLVAAFCELAREAGAADRGWAAARGLRAHRCHRGLLPRQRLRAPRPAHAEEAVSAGRGQWL